VLRVLELGTDIQLEGLQAGFGLGELGGQRGELGLEEGVG